MGDAEIGHRNYLIELRASPALLRLSHVSEDGVSRHGTSDEDYPAIGIGADAVTAVRDSVNFEGEQW
ncbi:hypothetical protein GCM10009631_04040 [Corynebacterium glaucum]